MDYLKSVAHIGQFSPRSRYTEGDDVVAAIVRATEDLLEVQVERDNTLKGLLSPNKQVKDVNLGKAFDDFVTFVQRYIGGEVISTGFSGHKQLDNKQPEFLRYEQEYGITIAHLITYLFEGTGEELRYHFYGTFRGLDSVFSSAQTRGREGVQPNMRHIYDQIGTPCIEYRQGDAEDESDFLRRMQQLTGGMSPGNITPFVDVYSSGGIFDIHFDREAIKTLLAYPRPVFIEIVRGRQDSYIVPLRLFLTFLILNGIYSPSDISEEPNDIFAQLQGLTITSEILDQVFQGVRTSQNVFQRYSGFKKALKQYFATTYPEYHQEIIETFVENFFRDFWNVEMGYCLEIARGRNIAYHYSKLQDTEYFRYLFPEEKRKDIESAVAYMQTGFEEKQIPSLHLGESTETAKTSEYYKERQKIIASLSQVISAGNITRISNSRLDEFLKNLRIAGEFACFGEKDGLSVAFATRKNIVSDTIDMLFGRIIDLVRTITTELQVNRDYFMGGSHELFISYFGLELSQIVSHPLYLAIWGDDEAMLQDIFGEYYERVRGKVSLLDGV